MLIIPGGEEGRHLSPRSVKNAVHVETSHAFICTSWAGTWKWCKHKTKKSILCTTSMRWDHTMMLYCIIPGRCWYLLFGLRPLRLWWKVRVNYQVFSFIRTTGLRKGKMMTNNSTFNPNLVKGRTAAAVVPLISIGVHLLPGVCWY